MTEKTRPRWRWVRFAIALALAMLIYAAFVALWPIDCPDMTAALFNVGLCGRSGEVAAMLYAAAGAATGLFIVLIVEVLVDTRRSSKRRGGPRG